MKLSDRLNNTLQALTASDAQTQIENSKFDNSIKFVKDSEFGNLSWISRVGYWCVYAEPVDNSYAECVLCRFGPINVVLEEFLEKASGKVDKFFVQCVMRERPPAIEFDNTSKLKQSFPNVPVPGIIFPVDLEAARARTASDNARLLNKFIMSDKYEVTGNDFENPDLFKLTRKYQY